MKIHFILINLFVALGVSVQAQSYYQSSGFEQVGMVEYIMFTGDDDVLYWTSKNKKAVKLIKVDENTEYMEVRFAKSVQVYRLEKKASPMVCVHPNGARQTFKFVNPVFISKNFRKQGVTEYLEYNYSEWRYWTSQNSDRVLLGEFKGSSKDAKGNTIQKIWFPNDEKTYQLIFVRKKELFEVVFIHPDGKRQYFTAKGF